MKTTKKCAISESDKQVNCLCMVQPEKKNTHLRGTLPPARPCQYSQSWFILWLVILFARIYEPCGSSGSRGSIKKIRNNVVKIASGNIETSFWNRNSRYRRHFPNARVTSTWYSIRNRPDTRFDVFFSNHEIRLIISFFILVRRQVERISHSNLSGTWKSFP